MPIPSTAKRFEGPLDPTEILVYEADLTQGATDDDLLRVGENVASFTVALPAESIMAGLKIMSGNGYDPTLSGLALKFYLTVEATQQSAAIFNASGTELGIECTFITTSTPPQTRQRTVVARVVQQ